MRAARSSPFAYCAVALCLCCAAWTRGLASGLASPAAYTNPVGDTLPAADPFVLRYAGRYYLYATNASDGFKCAVSSDLVNWLPLGYAYRRTTTSWAQAVFWAPEVIAYHGAFYLVFVGGNGAGSAMRICLARGERPEGPFKDLRVPLFDSGWSCIDPDLFVDGDGTPYLYFNRVDIRESAGGRRMSKIFGARLSTDLTRLDGGPVVCLDSYQPWEDSSKTGNWCNEGACAFAREEKYYLMFTAGHYANPGYSIGYATAPAPLGPWAKAANNPILARNDTAGVCGPGHNSVALSPDGRELFVVYHTHYSCGRVGPRPLNIDRLLFDGRGVLSVQGPTRTPQPMPSGAPAPLMPSDLGPDLQARCAEAVRADAVERLRTALWRSVDELPVVVSGSGAAYRMEIAARNSGPAALRLLLWWRDLPGVTPASSELDLHPGARAAAAFAGVAPAAPLAAPALCWAIVDNGDTLAHNSWAVRHARTGRYTVASAVRAGSALVLRDSSQVVVGRTHWAGPTDCSAQALVSRSGDTILVEVSVTDDSICTTAASVWDNDGVELYLDTRSTSDAHDYGPGVVQVACVPHLHSGTATIACRPALGDSSALGVRCERIDKGYRVRLCLASGALGSRLPEQFGLDVAVNDNDGAGRKAQLMWSGTRDNWQDTRGFGRMLPAR